MKQKRNESCHCGSGLKFKKCCMHAENLDHPDYPEQLFGYKTKIGDLDDILNPPPPRCMISNVTPLNQESINASFGCELKLGDWFLSETDEDGIPVVEGPYESMEQAMNIAKDHLGVISFR